MHAPTQVLYVSSCPEFLSKISSSMSQYPIPITKAPSVCPTSISGFRLQNQEPGKRITIYYCIVQYFQRVQFSQIDGLQYCIVGNFQGRKLSQIGKCDYFVEKTFPEY